MNLTEQNNNYGGCTKEPSLANGQQVASYLARMLALLASYERPVGLSREKNFVMPRLFIDGLIRIPGFPTYAWCVRVQGLSSSAMWQSNK